MTTGRHGCVRGLWAVVLLAAGCTAAPTAPAGTGARQAAEGYFQALVRQDWPGAYALLHPNSRHHHSPEQFARLAQQYRRGLGFEPDGVQVRTCDERGEEAIAHV